MTTTRIASLQPSITLTLHALGALDRLAACTKYCLEALPELADRNLTILHDSWSANTDEILSAKPDLVIASVPYRMESLAAILKSGLPTLTLAPHTVADIYKDIHLLAAIVDKQHEGQTLIGNMQNTIESACIWSKTSGRTPLVYCEEWGKPLIHSQHWVAELIEAAGGRFLGEPGTQTTPEAVVEANPDILIMSWCGAGDRVPLEKVVTQRNWQRLAAVRERRVYCVPDEYLNTPAHTLLEGLACLAAAIHPEIFPPHPRLIRLTEDAEPSGQDPCRSSAWSAE